MFTIIISLGVGGTGGVSLFLQHIAGDVRLLQGLVSPSMYTTCHIVAVFIKLVCAVCRYVCMVEMVPAVS